MTDDEIKVKIDCEDINALKLFGERVSIDVMSDQDWRDYQLNKILRNFDNSIGGRVELKDETVYVFKNSKSVGCVYNRKDTQTDTQLSKVSHLVTEIVIGNSESSAIIKILNTPAGKEVKELIKTEKIKLVAILFGKKVFRLDIDFI